MPRFAVLTHDHPVLHWDLMLDNGEVLRTWRLSHPPDADEDVLAEPLPDHRRAYLDYEGPVSGGRGEVRRWDAGDFVLLEEDGNQLKLQLDGEKLKGVATIELSGGDAPTRFYFTTD
jgi:hypothetical protein